MSISVNKHDTLEQLIYEDNIRIRTIDVHQDMDMLIIVLNTGAVLQQRLSGYPKLKDASVASLQNYELIGQGTGLHWPELDEDLSLKGFLKDAVRNQVLPASKVAM